MKKATNEEVVAAARLLLEQIQYSNSSYAVRAWLKNVIRLGRVEERER